VYCARGCSMCAAAAIRISESWIEFMTSKSHSGSKTVSLPRSGNFGSAKGQTVVEFALVVLLFFLLVFGVIDFGRLFFVQMSIQNAVQQAGRFAITGNHLPDPNNPGQNLSRVASIVKTAQDAAVGATITNVQVSSIQGGAGSAGGPGDTVTVTVTTSLALITPLVAQFFPGGTYTFDSSVSYKNEPFPAANTK